MNNVTNLNSIAIYELSVGNEELAQSLFRLNARKSKSCSTLNNIGVFYYQYGMILKTGKVINAKTLGLRYLLKAHSHGEDWRNLVSVSTALFEAGNITLSYEYLKRICNTCNAYMDALCRYNMGVCLYRMKCYSEARSLFMQLYDDKSIDSIYREGGQHPVLITAYCYLNEHNYVECIKSINTYRNMCSTADKMDVFCLRCYCHMYADAVSEIQELFREWYPSDLLLSFAAECFVMRGTLPINVVDYLDARQEQLWEQLTSDASMRCKMISENPYIPPFVDLLLFID